MNLHRMNAALIITLLGLALAPAASSATVELVKNSHSRFAIYVEDEASTRTMAIADTLQSYIRRVSGAELPITHALASGGRQIILEVGESHDPQFMTSQLGEDGFRISIEPKRIYLTGHTDNGLQNGVYTFLESYLNCRLYSPSVRVIPHTPTIRLFAGDDTQIPAITFRMQDIHDTSYVAWHKLDTHEEFGLFVHTFKTLVPPDSFFASHPEYFSLLNNNRTPRGQLCLTNPDVFRIVVERLRALMAARPEATFWSVSQNDTYVPCECAACRAIDSVEGSPSGSLLAFVNRVADEFPDKTISTLAYQYSRSAPKHLKPRPNVNIMLCSIECNRSKPLAEDPSSASFVQDVHDWSNLTHNIFLWDYVIQFRNLVSPFPNFHVLQPNIQYFVNNGITTVFEQGLGQMYGEFAELRIYLIAKLLWNPNLNVDSVMNDFLHGFYGDAAPYIRQYIDTMHAALVACGESLDIYGYPLASERGYLSPAMLDTYGALFDRAEDAVRSDSAVLARVQTCRLPLQYAILEQAKVAGTGDRGCFVSDRRSGQLSVRPEIEELLTRFVGRCTVAGIPKLWESGISPDEYLASSKAFLDGGTDNHLARGRMISVLLPASDKYHGGDATALVDGLKGWSDYHAHWLGFEDEDMQATIDLGSVQTVSEIRTDFLQDINSWIFMPLTVAFSLSADGEFFRTLGNIANTTPADKDGAIIAPFDVTFPPTEARYVRVSADNMETCPTWHKGSGGKAWIFIDEISVH